MLGITLTIMLLGVGFVVGLACGYWLRELKSRRHQDLVQKRYYERRNREEAERFLSNPATVKVKTGH